MIPLDSFTNFIGSHPTLDATFTFKKKSDDEILITITNHQKNSDKEANLDKTSFKYVPVQLISGAEKVRWLLKNNRFEVICKKNEFGAREVSFSLLSPSGLEWEIMHESVEYGSKMTSLSNGALISYGVNFFRVEDAMIWNWKTTDSVPISSDNGPYVSCIEISSDFYAMVGLKGEIEIRDTEKGKIKKFLWSSLTYTSRSLQLLSNGFLCEKKVYSEDNYRIILWDWQKGEIVQTWMEYKGLIELSNKDLLLFSDTSLDVFRILKGKYIRIRECEIDDDDHLVEDVFELKDKSILIVNSKSNKYLLDYKSCKIFNPTTKALTKLTEIIPLTTIIPFSEGFIGLGVKNKMICNVQSLTQKTLDSGYTEYLETISSFCRLIDGTIALGSEEGIFIILTIEGKCLFVMHFQKAIKDIAELSDGSLAVKTSQKVFILRPKKKEDITALKIAKLELKIKHSPDNLSLYPTLAEEYKKLNQSEKEYKLYLQGLSVAARCNHLYKARRFFEKASLLDPKKGEPYLVYLSHLDDKADRVEKRRVLLKFYKYLGEENVRIINDYYLVKDEKKKLALLKQLISTQVEKSTSLSAIKKLATERYKKRLEIGAGNFTFAKDLIDVHKDTHPKLAASIITTELQKPTDKTILNTVGELIEEGVSIFYNVDAQKMHKDFIGERIKRIHWNCPNGGGSPEMKNQFKRTFVNFFHSGSILQKPKDRIHVTLLQEPLNWESRQIDCDLVKASVESGYRLIRKRLFHERYPRYQHKKTNGNKSINSEKREFVFEKLSQINSSMSDSEDLPTRAQKLCNSKIKEYQVKIQKNNKERCYFECSTDGDSSDYFDSDSD